MSELDFESQLHSVAKRLEYPRTPDIAAFVSSRIGTATKPRFASKALAWSLTLIIALCSSLMAIPPARAAILEFIQIGIVRIFPRPTESPVEEIRTAIPDSLAPVTAGPYLNALPLLEDLNRLAGEITLAEAVNLVSASDPLRLPAYPPELGEPDRVFAQDAEGVVIILVWLDPAQPERMLMNLQRIPEASWMIRKFEPRVVETTTVNGQRAAWTEGPYPILLSNGMSDYLRMIEGHVLIWEENGITYRLETGLSLEEAVKVAESLQPAPR